MRTATLEPLKSKDSPNLPWCLSIPAYLSDTGKRQRKYFATRKSAETEAEKVEARGENFGISLNAMTPARIAEAAEAYKLLDHLGVGLLDAVVEYVETHKVRSASVPFGRLFDLYLEAKPKLSEDYKGQLRWTKERCSELHDRLASDVTVRDLDKVLKGEKATVKNLFMRCLRAVLNYGVKRDYLAANPVAKLDFDEVVKGDTQILEPAIVQDWPFLRRPPIRRINSARMVRHQSGRQTSHSASRDHEEETQAMGGLKRQRDRVAKSVPGARRTHPGASCAVYPL